MIKNKKKEELVKCEDCISSGDVFNFMTDCFDKEANPNGYKMGTYPRRCTYHKPKK